MDRIRRCEISIRLFLRPAEFNVCESLHSNCVRFGGGERGKCHEFKFREIHRTANGEIFLLLHRIGKISISIIAIFCSIRDFSSFERCQIRIGLGWRVKFSLKSIESDNSAVNAEFEIGWSSLGTDWSQVTRGIFVWWWLPPHPFHRFHDGGGNIRIRCAKWCAKWYAKLMAKCLSRIVGNKF